MSYYDSFNKANSAGGIGFIGLLQIAFIVLKLCNVIDWSWWVVFSPLIGSLAIIVILLAIVVFIVLRSN